MRLVVSTILGGVLGFFLGASVPTLTLTQMNLPSMLFPSIDLAYLEEKYTGLSTQALLNACSSLKGDKPSYKQSYIWVPTNPCGAERLPPGIAESTSDFYLLRLWADMSSLSRSAWHCIWQVIQGNRSLVRHLGKGYMFTDCKRDRCKREWRIFQDRIADAERVYYKAMGLDPPNATVIFE